jgi:hypothetical protein
VGTHRGRGDGDCEPPVLSFEACGWNLTCIIFLSHHSRLACMFVLVRCLSYTRFFRYQLRGSGACLCRKGKAVVASQSLKWRAEHVTLTKHLSSRNLILARFFILRLLRCQRYHR